MITTAALAWKQMGRDNFQRHVAVFARRGTLQPTVLFKMQPWTRQEIDEAKALGSTLIECFSLNWIVKEGFSFVKSIVVIS